MKQARGPRPWAVRIFALVLVGSGLWNFAIALGPALAEANEEYRIARVSVLSAQLLIVIIPVAAVWFLASRIAKWLMATVSAVSAVWATVQAIRLLDFGIDQVLWLLSDWARYSLVVLLFTPSARRWFASQCTHDAKAPE